MNQLMFAMFATSGSSHRLARQKRDAGIRQVSDNNREFLTVMRAAAKQICREKGWVCSDDLRAYSDRHRIFPSHFNAFGAILTTKEFVPGEYIVSQQPQGHCNKIRRWVLKDSKYEKMHS